MKNMAGSHNNFWGQHGMSRLCFGLSADMDHSLRGLQQQHMAKEFNNGLSQSPFYPDSYHLTSDNILRPPEGDQVVPSSHRGSVFWGLQREAKPLPPLPDPEELMSDEAADSEVEFFTSDRRSLLPKSCPKVLCRGGNRGGGQVNYAYQDSALRGDTGAGSMAFSWPGSEDRGLGRGSGFGTNTWTPQREEPAGALSCKQPDPSPRPRFSCSSPPSQPLEKPQIPPRIPISPKPPALSKTMSTNEEDKPPKIPPRVPLVPPCPPRTPSPKSLPIYINGVMPATQSFAANPNYVSKALQRQQSERAPPAAQCTPCIVPILKDGRQASTTHYILLPPGRPASNNRRERLQSEPTRKTNSNFWQNR